MKASNVKSSIVCESPGAELHYNKIYLTSERETELSSSLYQAYDIYTIKSMK